MSIEVKQMIIKSNITSNNHKHADTVQSSSGQVVQAQGEHTQNLSHIFNEQTEPRER